VHELPLTKSILEMAERYAKLSQASKVKAIFLRIGILRDLEPEWMHRYFSYISKGTIAEGAEILIMIEPVVLKCHNCGNTFGIELTQITGEPVLCPECAVHDYELINGMEFILQGIEAI